MTEREELITLLNHVSDEQAAQLLEAARTMSVLHRRSGNSQPSTTVKSLCAEDVCRMSEADARAVWVYANSLHVE
mgnify:CR=1 FL=1